MDRRWMRRQLKGYLRLLVQYRGMRTSGFGPDNPVLADLLRREATVKKILEALDPKLANFTIKDWDDEASARHAILRGIGVLDDREEGPVPATIFSDPTLGLLIRVGSKGMTASHIKTLMMETGIFEYGSRDDNKDELLRSRLVGARAAADDGDGEARRALLGFVEQLVQQMISKNPFSSDWLDDLQERLRADGLDIEVTVEGKPGRIQRHYRLLPTEPTPVALPHEITALEDELAARGYTIALNHYRQAVDGLVNKKYESANGDLRAALEDLVTRLAEDHAGYQRAPYGKTGQPSASQGGRAVRHLVDGGHLPEKDGGRLLDGLWSMTHTNGSHPGQSDAEETRFRMQLVTAVARFLLKHFPPTP